MHKEIEVQRAEKSAPRQRESIAIREGFLEEE
jgi:hypothetical protein